MLEYTYLKPYSTKHGKALKTLTKVYLDTTYAHPENIFPHQKLARDFISNVVEMRMKLDKEHLTKSLFVVGTYTIGKERILRDIASRNHCKVFVKKKKHEILKRLKLNYESIFTLMQGEADVYLVDMSDLHWKNVYEMKQALKNTYNHFFIFKPSAMANRHSKKKVAPGEVSVGKSKEVYTINVPYSEHSSFHELKSFCDHVSYTELIPTVYSSPEELCAIKGYLSPSFSFDMKEPKKIQMPYDRLGFQTFSKKKKNTKGTLFQFFGGKKKTQKKTMKKESAIQHLKKKSIPFSCEHPESDIVVLSSDDEVEVKKEESPLKPMSLFGKIRKSTPNRIQAKKSPKKKKRTTITSFIKVSPKCEK